MWPVAYSRCTTVSAASSRSGSSAAPGTAYGMRAAAIFFFARVMRAAIVGSETRKAWAMSAVGDAADEPQRQRDLRLLARARDGSR